MTIFFLIVAAFIGLGIWQTIKKNAEQKVNMAYYNSLLATNFNIAKKYIQPNALCMIALDVDKKQFLIASPNSHALLKYDEILKSEILIDGQTVASKSYGGALAGGLLFGATGAIVGGSGGKTKINKDIKSIKLKLLIKDVVNPARELTFYQKPGDANLKQAQQDCQSWHDTLTVALA